LPGATDRKSNSTSIKLKKHQIALFEKCKYQESKSVVSNTATDDCMVEEIECDVTSEDYYKREIEFLKKSINSMKLSVTNK
jgi:hypothetical protein